MQAAGCTGRVLEKSPKNIRYVIFGGILICVLGPVWALGAASANTFPLYFQFSFGVNIFFCYGCVYAVLQLDSGKLMEWGRECCMSTQTVIAFCCFTVCQSLLEAAACTTKRPRRRRWCHKVGGLPDGMIRWYCKAHSLVG